MKFLILGLIVICFTVFFMPQANAQSHDGYSWDDYACIDSMLEFDKQALLSLQQQLEESTNSEEQVNLINAAATIIQKYCPSIDFDIPKKVILKNGTYVGDGIDGRGWRRGGSPWGTTDLQWLLSSGGGIKPR